jgi:hypothetical protein
MKTNLYRKIRAEIDLLTTQGLVTAEQAQRLKERYPTEAWDLVSLARWLTILGAVATGAGVVLLAAQLDVWRTLLEAALAVAAGGLLWLGRWVGRARGMIRTQAALELLAAFAVQGLTAALAVHYSTGSQNWPALVGIDALAAFGLAYWLRNRLILILACINLFSFFGGETGYVSGWGVYWLGMNYPLRFFVAGLFSIGVAWVHAQARLGELRAFSRVYLHFGLLITNLSLWFFSLFGYYDGEIHWSGTEPARLAFSVLWAASSLACIWGGSRAAIGTVRAYGMVFLIIDVYTFYFQFVVANSAALWFMHMLLTGGSLVILAMRAERLRQKPN